MTLRRQINDLISEKNLLQIQNENLIAENQAKLTDQHNRVFDGEGGSLRHEFNLLQHELKQAKKVIYEYEKGSRKDSVSNNKSLQEYIKQMSDLENENDRLKRIIRDSHDP